MKGWILELPDDINAKLIRILDLLMVGVLMVEGPQKVKEPYVKPVKGHRKLFEIRAKGKDGIARVFYFTMTGQQVVLLHGFMKKSQKTPKREIDTALKRMDEYLIGK